MTKASLQSRAAFTLVELMIGATLSAALMAAVLSSYIYLGRNLARLANQQILETEGRRTLSFFTQDVESATGVSVTSVTAPDFSVTFALAKKGSGTSQVTYYYSRDGASTSISGNTISVPAHTLVRVVGTASAISQPAQVILRNIETDNDSCYIRLYDASGASFDNNTAPYTTTTTYSLLSVKQASLAFSTQLGNAKSGTQTQEYAIASSRITLRNRGFLP